MKNYNQIASDLDQAAHQATAVDQISTSRSINLEESYGIQSISIGRRYQRGERFTGIKLGFTSKAKMEQMGVHDMIWGRLTDHMYIESGSDIQISGYIHPRAEPEIAFLVSRTIDRKLSLDNVKDYITGVAIAIEVIDSRYKNFKFSLEDVIADNCSSSGYAIGPWHPTDTPIEDIDMSINADGEILSEGRSSAILGNPWESAIAAARLTLDNGEILREGDVILAGAATAAHYIQSGQNISARGEGLGEVHFNVK